VLKLAVKKLNLIIMIVTAIDHHNHQIPSANGWGRIRLYIII